jgi:hypothetical protein
MPEVLEIEQVEVEVTETNKPKWDSWTVEIPPEIIEAQDLKDGKIEGEIISPLSGKLKEISKRILEKNRKVYEELKRLGD